MQEKAILKLFISYNHENEGSFFYDLKPFFEKYEIRTYDWKFEHYEGNINYAELIEKINGSNLFICLYSQSFRNFNEFDIAIKADKPILIIKKNPEVEINPKYSHHKTITFKIDDIESEIKKYFSKSENISYWFFPILNKSDWSEIYDIIIDQAQEYNIRDGDKVWVYQVSNSKMIAEIELNLQTEKKKWRTKK